jgi:hypothetical protein
MYSAKPHLVLRALPMLTPISSFGPFPMLTPLWRPSRRFHTANARCDDGDPSREALDAPAIAGAFRFAPDSRRLHVEAASYREVLLPSAVRARRSKLGDGFAHAKHVKWFAAAVGHVTP